MTLIKKKAIRPEWVSMNEWVQSVAEHGEFQQQQKLNKKAVRPESQTWGISAAAGK